MAVRPIVRFPDPRLRKPSVPVAEVNEELRKAVADMADSMYAANGAGIAAVQAGFDHRMFLVDAAVAGGREEDPPLVFINPELVWLGPEIEERDEGCLSFPGIFVPIKRALRARVRGTDLDGRTVEMEGEGLVARAFQHEMDHLNGKLIIDFVGPLKKELIKRKMKREAARQQEDEEEART